MKSQEAAPDSEQKKGLNDCEPLMARSKYKLTLPAGELGVAPASTVSLGWPRLAGTEQVASLKEMQKWSGYSVDRRGFYCPDGELGLWTKDPMNRPFWRVPGRFEKNELEDHLLELFPEGLSLHGWQYMLDRHDFIRHPVTNDAFVNHTWQVELTFEMVRRAAFPKMNSRLQSYFAWETFEDARNFQKHGQAIYRTQSDNGFRADQNWLSLGAQGIATSLCAHIEPDKQISRIRLSDKTSRLAFACEVRRLIFRTAMGNCTARACSDS
jgi:hypothetical protein